MAAIRPWHLVLLLAVLMFLGGVIGAVFWSTSRGDRGPTGDDRRQP
jgi:hypothetical protein